MRQIRVGRSGEREKERERERGVRRERWRSVGQARAERMGWPSSRRVAGVGANDGAHGQSASTN